MASKGKIVREEYFPDLVLNGFDKLGIVLWVDYGTYFKVCLKSEYKKPKQKEDNTGYYEE